MSRILFDSFDVPPAGSASTGALSATLDGVTLAATGSLEITGTETTTLDAVTLAATGSLSINGSLSSALDGATLTATGSIALSGALSSALDDVTLSAIGSNGAPVVGVDSQGGAGWFVERESQRLPTVRVAARVAILHEPRPTTSRVTGRSLRPIRARVESARVARPETDTASRAIVRGRATVRFAAVATESRASAIKRARPTAIGQWNKREMLREFWRVNRPRSSS